MRVKDHPAGIGAFLFSVFFPGGLQRLHRGVQILGCAVGALRIGLQRGAVCGRRGRCRFRCGCGGVFFRLFSICRFAFSLRGLLRVCPFHHGSLHQDAEDGEDAGGGEEQGVIFGQGVHRRAQGIYGVGRSGDGSDRDHPHPRQL